MTTGTTSKDNILHRNAKEKVRTKANGELQEKDYFITISDGYITLKHPGFTVFIE